MKTFFKQNATWLIFFVSSIVMLCIAIVSNAMMLSSAEIIEEASSKHMLALSRAAALLVSADELDRYAVAEDMDSQGYRDLKEKLIVFNEASGTEFTYYLRLDTDTNRMQFIIDNTADEYSALSDPPVPREYAPDLALSGVANTVALGSYSDGWEGYLTAFAPVYYADGRISNTVAGVDALDVSIKEAQENMHRLSLLLIVSTILVIGSCLTSLLLYQRKVEQAQIASVAKSSFLSRMSHEIRTPLNAIVGFCNMSLESNDMSVIKENLSRIDSSSQHLRRIIDDVLDISKIESGKLVLEYIPVNLKHEITQIEHVIRPQATAKNQNLIIEVGRTVPLYVQLDVTHIRQIVVNLLSNAVKFTPDHGTITLAVSLLETSADKYNLLWRVEDTGIGISAEQLEKLFLPFEQADISTTRKYGGTGLGLSIAKQLVEMMGGEIQIESSPGKGSKFSFNLWLGKSDEATLIDFTEPESPRRTADLRGDCILLVEDVETNQIIAKNMLEKYGAHVDIAENGLEGYSKYAANPDKYSMILMDVQMPIMDGYEATKKIRASVFENAAYIPIVAMTANVYKEDIDKALASGMNAHIGKPFDMVQINQVMVKYAKFIGSEAENKKS